MALKMALTLLLLSLTIKLLLILSHNFSYYENVKATNVSVLK